MKRYRPCIETGRYAFMESKAVLREDPGGECVLFNDHLVKYEILRSLAASLLREWDTWEPESHDRLVEAKKRLQEEVLK